MNKYLILLILLLLPIAQASDYGVHWKPTAGTDVNVNTYTGNLTNLSEMADVNIPSPSNDEVLTWDSATLKWIAKAFDIITNSSNYWDNLDTPLDITEMGNITLNRVNATCCVYLGAIQSTDGNSIAVQPTGDEDDFFSFKTPANRPTIKREGGKYIYIESTNVYDMGISFRDDDTYSGTVNYEKDNHIMTLLGKNSPIGFKANSEYNNYILFETYNHQPQMSVYNGTTLLVNDSLEVVDDLNVTGNYINGAHSGITGNYTNGNCWMAYSGGIMYSTNCTSV